MDKLEKYCAERKPEHLFFGSYLGATLKVLLTSEELKLASALKSEGEDGMTIRIENCPKGFAYLSEIGLANVSLAGDARFRIQATPMLRHS